MKTTALTLAAVLGLAAAPAFAQTSPAQVTVSAPLVAAPVPTENVHAPVSSGHCGLFQTCANTKIGLGKGDFIVRLSALGVMPEDRDSKLWLNGNAFGGRIKTTRSVMPELTFEYFFTDHISADLIAASTRHEVAAEDTALGKIDVGSAWALPPTVTFAWHFRPHKTFNPYVGVGATLAFFHNTSPAGGLVQKLNVGVTGGPSVNAGFDYQLVGNWFFNFDVKQMFMRMHAWANERGSGAFIRAHDSLDPTVVGAGIEYRF
ncbi:OmpW/AlkL family protein [Gluconobacter wancherniae]|uniref:OmpW/AlkL family protein n=1 Tax=Gluconobacter wancherniae TaxID=1307955 RepID=UPI001B8AC413|nr:OmpW family outer membrane protein [Gluconobacter wancherniae]MBS1063747.1 OmpW family protein [Gluconobacter wancherniae]MBS1089559.1 OmpW family protein [Gluconobacter wancherniae]MBS1095332.1 OmpW family protein [Gluconobacter wancherniae]